MSNLPEPPTKKKMSHHMPPSLDLLSWLAYVASTSAYVKLNPNAPAATHYRMDGGKLAIDPVMMDEFLKQYALALDRKEVISFVERRTDIYKMHYDLDVLDTAPWNEATITYVLREIRNAMATCFPVDKAGALFRMVVLTAPPKQIGDLWKTGIHVIYPDLQVDSVMGLTLRKVAVMHLNKLERRVEPQNCWDDVLDRCVHVANGLRMVGSVKMSKCINCANKRKKMRQVGFDQYILCDDCSGKTMLNDGRAYTALLMLDSAGNKDEHDTELLRQNYLFCVKLSSIRCFSPLGATKNEFFACPAGVTLEEPSSKDMKRKGTLVVSRKEFRDLDRKKIMGNNRLVPLLEHFLNTNPLLTQLKYNTPSNPYKDVSAIKVLYNKNKSSVVYLVNVDGPGSTFCNNKGGHHNSSHVFFEFRSKYMVQRCFCSKSPVVDGGVPCKDYISPKVMLPEDLTALLFPVATSNKALVVTADVLKDNICRNMKGCVSSKPPLSKKREESALMQSSWQRYKKQVDFLHHMSITLPPETVPLSKDTMYPSRVSSQLCRLTSEQVDNATAGELFNWTDNVVTDLKKTQEEKGEDYKKSRFKKRKRVDSEE
jgi:hypothetical protein